MKNHPLNDILNRLAEKGVPEEVDLRSAVYSRLDAPAGQPPKGNFSMKARMLVIAAIALLGVFLLTPQGSALAHSLFQFFAIAESDVMVFPTATPTETITATEIPMTTENAAIETPAALPTEQEIPDVIGDLTVEDAEALAGFDIRVPESLPDGYSLSRISYYAPNESVTLWYAFYPPQTGEMILLTQSRVRSVDEVGSSAKVDVFEVGGHSVEMVYGGWIFPDDSSMGEWVNELPSRTFRWEEKNIYFTLMFLMNEPFGPAYLPEEQMLDMVAMFLGVQTAMPAALPAEQTLDLDYLPSIEATEQVAGFGLLAPAVLPEGVVFEHARYIPELSEAILYYGLADNPRGWSLLILEKRVEDKLTLLLDNYPPEAIAEVMIGGQPGTYIQGSIVDGVYEPLDGQYLEWDTGGLNITIIDSGMGGIQTIVDQEMLLTIAESMQ